MEHVPINTVISLAAGVAFARRAGAQESLPLPPKSSGSVAARTMPESACSPPPPVGHPSKDAPVRFNGQIGPAQAEFANSPAMSAPGFLNHE